MFEGDSFKKMSNTKIKNRIYGNKKEISKSSVKSFFLDRANRYDPLNPLVSVLYQDSNPELAIKRDIEEKKIITHLLGLNDDDRVLDIGCGIGRWAEKISSQVSLYHGTDLIPGFIEIATARCSAYENTSFQVISAQDISPSSLAVKPPFSLVLISGLLIYLSDSDVEKLLKNIRLCVSKRSRILIREPIALDQRLTLDNYWSEELKSHYSSIYRTASELREMFTMFLGSFKLCADRPLFDESLSNRRETRQHLFQLVGDL